MKLMKYDPFREMDLFRDRLNQLLGSVLGHEQLAVSENNYQPRCDITETENEVIVKVDLPGIDEKNVNLTISGDNLIIKGEREAEKEDKNKHHHRIERYYGSFERVINLPLTVNKEAINAEYEKGVLLVTLPKVPELKPKDIPIKVKK